ncbi:MAG: InlB B-repeat-containing protein [Methanomassiliicoccaceae archaeon]|nr:InlB B-repeat-containing protein [Methanomassiliicoccaceae archaeon]
MSPSKKKAVITAISLALLASLAAACIVQTATQTDAYPGTEVDLADINPELLNLNPLNAGDTYVPADTICLPGLSYGEYAVIDGARTGGKITISSFTDGVSFSDAIFFISGDNQGTYYFQNLIMESGGHAAIMVDESSELCGKVVIKEVDFTTYYSYSVAVYNGDLEIESCYFEEGEDGYIYSQIDFFGGKLTMKDSFIYSYTQGMQVSAGGKVAIDNCYFECAITSIHITSAEGMDLAVSDCTFIGSYISNSIEIILMDAEDNKIELTHSLFKGKEYYESYHSSPAIYVGGDGEGSVKIIECYFTGIITDNRPIVNLEKASTFLISGTTFSNNATGESDGPADGKPILMISGDNIEGKIINSTFSENRITIDGSVRAGCVLLDLDGGSADLFHNTFFDNYCFYIPIDVGIMAPTSVEIFSGSINMVNNIFVCQIGDASTIWNEGGTISADDGNIDKTDPSVIGPSSTILIATGGSGNNGRFAGCDLSGTSPEEILTIGIVPFGEADGTGNAGMGFSLPGTDQRGKSRSGLPDIGAVCISSALFHGNGGGWDLYTTHNYSAEEPYWFTDSFTGLYFTGYAGLAVAENTDGKILLPSYDVGSIVHDELRLLGWSTENDAELPDPMFTDFFGTILGNFATDTEYYAIWGEDFVIVFIPGNGKAPETKEWGPGGTTESPVYGTVNGMNLIKWTYDEAGTLNWDPTMPLDGNTAVYGWWESIVSADLKVEFRDGIHTSTATVPHGGRVSKPADPVREGYTFKGWFTTPEGDTKWDFNSPVTKSMTLYAQWEGVTFFTVTFNSGGSGSAAFTVEVEKGQSVSVPQVPGYKGHIFKGWFTSSDGGTQWDFDSPVMGHMTLYAHWEADTEEGEGEGEETDALVIVAAVVASVFASIGLVPLAAMGLSGVTTQVSIANVFQQGMYGEPGVDTTGEEKNRRAVIFDPRNGKSSWASSVIIGRQADRPGNPKAPKGKMFLHWSESPEGPPFDFLTPITKVTHLYAVYADKGMGENA